MRKIQLLRLLTAIVVMGIIYSSTAFTQTPVMKHSYTFEDGTATDVVGGADGVLQGDAFISDGFLTLSGTGFVSLPGKDMNINTWNGLTVELVFNQAPDLIGVFAMLLAMGQTNPDVNWMGINYFMFQPVREDAQTRTAISCLNTSDPWATETGVSTQEINDDYLHYVTCMVSTTEISMYIDGAFKGSAILSADNQLANVSNDTGYIGASVYPNDAKWRGIVDEVNFWEGIMDEATIKQRASELLGDAFFDATLSDLSTVPGTIDPPFDPGTDIYEVYVDYGTPFVTVNTTTSVLGATVKMFDGLANEVGTDGRVYFTGDGIDIEIIVTALDGNTELSYYLSVFTNPENEASTLSEIQLSAGAFTTEFHPDSTEYTAIVPYGTTSVDVTGVPVWAGETVSGDGTITLTDGTGTATITVTSENAANTTVYTVNLYASVLGTGMDYYIVNEVSGFVVGESGDAYNMIRLYPPVKDETKQLFQIVESGVDGQYYLVNGNNKYLSLSPTSSWDMLMRDNLTTNQDSCRFEIEEFEPGRFLVKSVARMHLNNFLMGPNNPPTAGEGIYSDKWPGDANTVWNIQFPVDVIDPFDTYLSDLSVDVASLSPAFVYYTKTYTVILPPGTTSMNISATANDPTTTITGAGTVDVSSGKGSVTVTVTATDTQYKTEYVINYLVDTPLTLKHSWTFADGTGQDVVGGAHGNIQGGDITDGVFTSQEDGDFIILPSQDIRLNEYPSITMETWVTPHDNTNYYAMLAYFGGLEGSNSFWLQIARGDETSRFELNAGGVTSVSTLEPGPLENHHYVAVASYDTLYLYVDGALVGKSATPGNSSIANISSANGWLCDGGYGNDPSWLGAMYEFNIYSGQMDPATVALHAANFPLEDATSEATLSDLMLDGTTISNFVSYKLSYDVVLPKGTTNAPAVTATTKNASASAVVTDAGSLPGTATVVVTAEDGTTTVTYEINFTIELSDVATLSDLTVDGTTIDGFNSEVVSYNYIVPDGTTTPPTVAGTATDATASVVVNDAASIPGTTTVVVTAEDGVTVITYSVNFKFDLSTDATLSDLMVDGTTVNNFDPGTINYTVTLPFGTTVVPTVTVTTTDDGASYVINAAASLPGTTTVVVTAEDGETEIIYSIFFDVETSVEIHDGVRVKVYPTISSEDFRVKASGQINMISVYDVTGKVVLQKVGEAQEQTISIPNAGMYFVKVECDGVSRIFKVFKTN